MKRINIQNHKINYIKKGKGISVIFIHGWNCSIPFWQYNIGKFSEKFCVYALDLPGFGNSNATMKTYSIGEYTEFLNKFMEKLKIKKAILIGHSMGGAIALDFVEKYPDKVRQMVLIDTLIRKVPFIVKFLLMPYIGKIIQKITLKNYNYLRYTGWVLFYNKEVYNDNIINSILKTDSEASIESLRSYNKTNFTDTCKKINAPVLIVIGNKTIFIMKRHAKLLNKNIRNSKIIIIEKSAHAPMMENSTSFNNHILHAISKTS